MIYKIHAELKSDHIVVLRVLASAGTYIKELVHGDLGRTNPSIGGILNKKVDIMQLDVTGVYDQGVEVAMQDENWHKIPLN